MIYIVLFNKIKEQLQSIPELKSIDWYNEQYNHTETDFAELYPAVYIEFNEPTTWVSAGNKMQESKMQITLHVVVFDVKTDPISCLVLLQKVFKKIFHHVVFDGVNQITTPMDRISTEVVKRYKNLKVSKIEFEFTCFDITAMDEYINHNPELEINVTIS